MPMASCWTISNATLTPGAMPLGLVQRSGIHTATAPLIAGTFLCSTLMDAPGSVSTSVPTSGAPCQRCQGRSKPAHVFTMLDLSSSVCRLWPPTLKRQGSRICVLWAIQSSVFTPLRTTEGIEVQRPTGWPSYARWRSWTTTCRIFVVCRRTCTLHSSPGERRAARM